jgi:diguanylate cyclase (GGDEF)-like protein
MSEPIRVLIIEDNTVDAVVTARRLLKDPPVRLEATTVASLAEAWPVLDRDAADVVVTDLNLPESDGLDTLAALRIHSPHVPIVVLTAHAEKALGVRAVQMGAQDFLQKGQFDSQLIQRALLYAIERHRFVQALRDLSLIDPLTGLYNRRGFFAVAGKRAEVARRLGCRAFVLYADLDGLKQVNDSFGHPAGDTYVQVATEAITRSFRAADVIARVGGDEFVVLGLEAGSFEPSLLTTRLQRALGRLGEEHRMPHAVSMSCGIELFEPETVTIEQAIERADAAMYAAKREKKGT